MQWTRIPAVLHIEAPHHETPWFAASVKAWRCVEHRCLQAVPPPWFLESRAENVDEALPNLISPCTWIDADSCRLDGEGCRPCTCRPAYE